MAIVFCVWLFFAGLVVLWNYCASEVSGNRD